ncbi:type II toxin-antitoxin system RelB/DinJ family antitoxin [bacterium]|nr:type II toxin-antitoxin system RelB/DinJ family antitoxin [bacterium]
MNKSATIQARIDPEVKTRAQEVLNALQISMSEAISLFLNQVSIHRGIPFEIKLPNKLTAQTLRESDKGINIHQVNNVQELFDELNK